jgi:hypothetical protein
MSRPASSRQLLRRIGYAIFAVAVCSLVFTCGTHIFAATIGRRFDDSVELEGRQLLLSVKAEQARFRAQQGHYLSLEPNPGRVPGGDHWRLLSTSWWEVLVSSDEALPWKSDLPSWRRLQVAQGKPRVLMQYRARAGRGKCVGPGNACLGVSDEPWFWAVGVRGKYALVTNSSRDGVWELE